MSTVADRIARKTHACSDYWHGHVIQPGERYRRHVAFPGDEGHEEGTRPWVLKECDACVKSRDIHGEPIRQRYGVPAHIDARITYQGKPGRIWDFAGGLRIWLDGGRWPMPVHPMDIDYPEMSDVD